uniref:Reverse transcriptase domain-containing protein n=1 Tax=Amphilophus citrinellus TaxID=61819 RepID=A0A3Q0QRA2_AMPCI
MAFLRIKYTKILAIEFSVFHIMGLTNDLKLLNLCKAFRGDKHILLWFESYVSNRLRFVHVNGESSTHTKVVLLESMHFDCYTADTQLYLSMKPDDTHQLVKLRECLKDLMAWMTSNFLLLNSDKTEVIVLDPTNLRNLVSNHILTLDGITLASSNTVRNLGSHF